MKKKILLSILLSLFLFIPLSLSLKSYAYKYEFTADDIRAIRIHFNDAISWAGNFRDKTLEYQNTYDIVVINIVKTSSTNTTPLAYVYGFNKNSIDTITNENNLNYMQIKLNSTSGKMWRSSDSTERNVSVGYFDTGAQLRNQYSVWNNDLNSSVTGPTQLGPTILTFIPSNYFTYNYISSLNDIQVEDFNLMKQISKSDISSYVAEFGLYTNLDVSNYKPSYTLWKYSKPENYFVPIKTFQYNNYSYVNDELGRIYLTSSMLITNTIIEINLWPISTEDFSPLSILFYVVDSNSLITTYSTTGKPKLDEDNTFTPEYYEEYTNIINNILNENKGNITNSSGDVTGSVDFSPIVEEQKDEFDFWKNTYNSLFTISSGESAAKIEDLYNNLNISGDQQEKDIIDSFMNVLEGEASDFIISWGDVYIPNIVNNERTLLVGANQINFSQLCRDVPEFNTTKGYINIIVSTILIIVLIMNYTNTIMRLLGTENRFIEDPEVTYEVMDITNDNMIGQRNLPTWTGNDAVYWNNQYRKWRRIHKDW